MLMEYMSECARLMDIHSGHTIPTSVILSSSPLSFSIAIASGIDTPNMQLRHLLLAVILAVPHSPTSAKNIEDIQGILSDTVVTTPDLCQILCHRNKDCVATIFHYECNECWQLDCVLDDWQPPGFTLYSYEVTDIYVICNSTVHRSIRIPEAGCNNLTASVTVSKAVRPTGTLDLTPPSVTVDSAAIDISTSLLRLGTIVIVVMASVA